jgi:hypothetical protein
MNTRCLTRRSTIRLEVGTVLMPACIGRVTAASVPTRENIDNLAADELETYKHAVKILVERGQPNPNVKEGYAWQARVHNEHEREAESDLQRGCEHRSGFFPLASYPPRRLRVSASLWCRTL